MSGATIGASTAGGAAAGSAAGPWGALAGALLGLGSGVAGYQAASKEYKRKRGAINSAQAQIEAINRAQLQGQFDAGGQRQSSLMDYLGTMVDPSRVANAQGNVAARSARITDAAGPVSSAVTDPTVDATTAAAYRAGNRFHQAGQKVDLAQALINEIGRQNQTAGRQVDIRGTLADQKLQSETLQRDLERQRVQQWLQETLGSPSNGSQNLSLLGSLLGAGSQGAMMYAGAQGGRGGNQAGPTGTNV